MLNDVPSMDLIRKPVQRVHMLFMYASALALIFFINNPTRATSLCILLIPVVDIYLLSALKQDENSIGE